MGANCSAPVFHYYKSTFLYYVCFISNNALIKTVTGKFCQRANFCSLALLLQLSRHDPDQNRWVYDRATAFTV